MSSEDEFDKINRKKRKITTAVISDNEVNDVGECSQTRVDSSDSDSAVSGIKRKRISKSRQIISDEDGNESGSDDSILSGDESVEDSEDDESGSEDYENDDELEEDVIGDDKVGESDQSDESDGQSEKCPICLNKFRGQETGTPESCDHMFCLDCIQEWSRNVNTCPQDRQVFNLILVKDLSDKIIKRIPVVSKQDEPENDAAENDTVVCEVCGRGDREETLLLCDGCDSGCHCECMDPPLTVIPISQWFCSECSAIHDPNYANVRDEVRDLVRNNFRPQPFRRAIARTRASENVRSRIERLRMTRGILELENLAEDDAIPARAPVQRRAAPRKKYRRRRKRRKTTASSSTSKTKSSSGKTKTRRRKTKTRRKGRRTFRSKRAARPLISTDSVKKRIAAKLGLTRPPPGRTIPLVKAKPPPAGEQRWSRQGVGNSSRGEAVPSLSIFGDREELIEFEDSYLSDNSDGGYGGAQGGGSGEVLATPRMQHHRPSLNLKKAAAILNGPSKSNNKRVPLVIATPSTSTASFDLLGSILQKQTILHSNSEKLKITRNGNVVQTEPVAPNTLVLTKKMAAIKNQPITNRNEPNPGNSGNPVDPGHSGSSSRSSVTSPSTSRAGSNVNASRSQESTGVVLSTTPSDQSGGRDLEPDPNSGGDESPCAFDTRRKAITKNKDSKTSQSDDDIDIYSDIETISNDENEVFPQGGNTDESGGAKCNSASSVHSEVATPNPMGQPNVSEDSSDDELVIDEEAAQEHELTQKISACLDLESVSGPESPDPEEEPEEPYSSPRSKLVESVASVNSSQDYAGSIDVESVDGGASSGPKVNEVYNPESPTTDNTPNQAYNPESPTIDNAPNEAYNPESPTIDNAPNEVYNPESPTTDNTPNEESQDMQEIPTQVKKISTPPYDPEASITGDEVSQENPYNTDEQESVATTAQDNASPRHTFDDDVISAKVGSPISESEDNKADKEQCSAPNTDKNGGKDTTAEPEADDSYQDDEGEDYDEEYDYDENYDENGQENENQDAAQDAEYLEEENPKVENEQERETDEMEVDNENDAEQENEENEDAENENDPDEERLPEQIGDEDQEPEQVGDEDQEAEQIGDDDQEAEQIGDDDQEAEQIGDDDQEAEQIGDDDQEAEQIGDEDQEAEQIGDDDQEPEQSGDENDPNPDEAQKDPVKPETEVTKDKVDNATINSENVENITPTINDEPPTSKDTAEKLNSRAESAPEEPVKDVDETFSKMITDGVEDISDVGSDDNQLDYGEEEDNPNVSKENKANISSTNKDSEDEDDDEADKPVDELEDDDALPAELEEIADDIKLEKSDIEDFDDSDKGLDKLLEIEAPKVDNSNIPFVPVVVQKFIHKDTCSKSRSSKKSDSNKSSKTSSERPKNDKTDSSEINWKKPSKSTKERSYRDGKYRDEKVIFGERELKDKGDDKKRDRDRDSRKKTDDSNRKGSERKAEKSEESERRRDAHARDESERDRDRHERRKDGSGHHGDKKKEDKRGGGSSRSEKHRRDHSKERRSEKDYHYPTDKDYESDRRHREKKSNKEHHEKSSRSRHDKEKFQSGSSTSKRTSDKEKVRDSRDTRDRDIMSSTKHSSSKLKRKEQSSPEQQLYNKYNEGKAHQDNYYAYDEEYRYLYDDDPHLEQLQPVEKRRERDVRKIDDTIIVEKREKPSKKSDKDRKLRDDIYSSLPVDSAKSKVSSSPSPEMEVEISDVESKEIFSKEDGSIVINVNYNRNKEVPAKDKAQQLPAEVEPPKESFDNNNKTNKSGSNRTEPETSSKKARMQPPAPPLPQMSWNSDEETPNTTKDWSDRVDHPPAKPRSPPDSPPPEDDSNDGEKSLGYAIVEEKLADKSKLQQPPVRPRKKQSPIRMRVKESLLSKSRQKSRQRPEVITISESDDELGTSGRERTSPQNEQSNGSRSVSKDSHREEAGGRKNYRTGPASSKNQHHQHNEANIPSEQDARNKESLNFSGMFNKRQPRSPSPPSPMDNESYDPCEPTRSPSYKGSDGNNSSNHSESMSRDPKPPPEPELPPLPPEPEPHTQPATCQGAPPPNSTGNMLSIAVSASSPSVAAPPQAISMQQNMLTPPINFPVSQAPPQFQNSIQQSGPITSMPNIHLPPPNFMTQSLPRNMGGGPVPLVTAGLQGLQGLRWSLGGAPPTMLFPAGNQMQHVMHGNFIGHQMPQRLPHPGAQISGMMPPPNSGSLAMLHPIRQQITGPPLLPTPNMNPQGSMNALPLSHRQINMPDITQPPPNMLQSHHQHRLGHDNSGRQQGRGSPLIKTYTSLPMIVSSMPLVTTVPVTVISQMSHANNAGGNNNYNMQGQGLNKNEAANDVVDMDVDSPYSPPDSPGLDNQMDENISPENNYKNKPPHSSKVFQSGPPKDAFDALLAAVPKLLEDKATRELLVAGAAKVSKMSAAKASTNNKGSQDKTAGKVSRKHAQAGASSGAKQKNAGEANERTSKHKKKHHGAACKKGGKRNETQLKIIDDVPNSAVELQVKEKYMKKLNRQERVVEEVKLSLKPFYNKKDISKEDYKAILRKCVPKVCHNKSGEINPVKIKAMVDTYVKKYRHVRKKTQKSFES